MTNSEIEKVMGKLIFQTDVIAEETAELVKDLESRIPKAHAKRINARVTRIKKAALDLRMAFDMYQ
jgi:hypothetical protein